MANSSVPSIDLHLKSPTQGLLVGLATGFLLGATSAFLWYSSVSSKSISRKSVLTKEVKGKISLRNDKAADQLDTPRSGSTEASLDGQSDLKMVLLVRSDLKMVIETLTISNTSLS
jgi:hypothetical protein